MKILCISNADNGGNAYFTAEAINRYAPGHEARAIRLMQNWIDYPHDLLAPDPETIRRLVGWADVVHGRDHEPPFVPASKPVVMTYSGMSFRHRPSKYAAMCAARGWLLTVSTIDLTCARCAPAPLWIPNPREEMACSDLHDRFTFAHAPTFRDRKGTDVVEAAARKIGAGLDVVERTPWAECLKRKARCHALVDQFTYCYGNNAIETWALGRPVVSNASDPAWIGAIEEANGWVPFLQARHDVDDLAEKMALLRDDAAVYREWAEKGQEYFRRWHWAPRVAERALEMYEKARGMR